jgi:hypothetical protein
MTDHRCKDCGADKAFDERCSPTTHAAIGGRKKERELIVKYLRSAPLKGPAETVYADAIERGKHEEFDNPFD